MEVSIVIVSYNVKDVLKDCLLSIRKFTDANVTEVIIVDNNSSDGTVNELKTFFPEMTFVANENNVGFSAANNQGIEISKGEFVFLLNPDTILTDNTTVILSSFMKQNRNTAIVVPQLLNEDRSLQVSCWKITSIWNILFTFLLVNRFFKIGNYSLEKFNHTFNPQCASGAAMLFRKKLTEEIGLLDSNLFWMEDVDFCYRASMKGVITYTPNSKIIHLGGKSSSSNPSIMISNQIISKLKFYKKHRRYLSFVISTIILFFHIISRMIGYGISSIFMKQYRKVLKAYSFTFSKFIRYILLSDQSLN